MILAKLTVIDNSHAQMVVEYPGNKTGKPVIVSSKSEAQYLVNQETRKYIADIFCEWFRQRISYFNHIKDWNRAAIATTFISSVRSKHTLDELVDLLIRREGTITFLAPGSASRYYKTYQTVVMPVLQMVNNELKGRKHE